MDALINFIREWNGEVKVLAGVLISFVAIIFMIGPITRSFKEFGKKNFGEGSKYAVGAILIALLAFVGVVGVIKVVNSVKPDFADGNSEFRASSVVEAPQVPGQVANELPV